MSINSTETHLGHFLHAGCNLSSLLQMMQTVMVTGDSISSHLQLFSRLGKVGGLLLSLVCLLCIAAPKHGMASILFFDFAVANNL